MSESRVCFSALAEQVIAWIKETERRGEQMVKNQSPSETPQLGCTSNKVRTSSPAQISRLRIQVCAKNACYENMTEEHQKPTD